MPQEAFDGVSSRTYVSMVERSVNAPTFVKIDALVRVLNIHPLTVLALSYCESPTPAAVSKVLDRVMREVDALGMKEFSPTSLPRGKGGRTGT